MGKGENVRKKQYKLFLSMPCFVDLDKREEIIYKKWIDQFSILKDTFSFLPALLGIEQIKGFSLEAKFIGMEYAKGLIWTDDNGNESTFIGYIVTIETEEYLEKYLPWNCFYIEDKFKNDFYYGEEYCVLEGDNEITENTKKFLNGAIKDTSMGILDLYKYPDKMLKLKSYAPKNLVIDTTLFNKKGLVELLEYAEKIDYIPEKIFYLNEVVTTKYSYEKITY